jgi:outer membrane cobalamin receptor
VGALLAFGACTASAQEAPTSRSRSPDVETLVVTGSREPLPIAGLPGSVDVIPGAEIETGRFDGVLEVLRHRAGLHAEQPGARGSRASVYVRGLDPNHVLVLIDGVVVNDPTNARGGSFDFSTLGVDDVDRIEVVRGPLSASLGSDALAGAIQVITRGGRGPDSAVADVSGGRFGYFRGQAGVRGQRGPFDLAITGSYQDEGTPEDIGNFRGGALHASAGIELPRSALLRAVLRYTDSVDEAYPDFSGGSELAVIRELETRDVRDLTAGLDLAQKPLDWLEVSLAGSAFLRHEERRSPGVAPSASNPCGVPAEPDTTDRLRRYRAALQATAKAPYGLSFTAGGDVYWERGITDGVLVSQSQDPMCATAPADFDLERVVGGPFGEAYWDSGFGLTVLAGVRADFTSEDRREVTPRVSGAYSLPWAGLRLDASWGRGFKLPSFFAIASPVGNPDLVPETSQGFDVGLRTALWGDRLTAQATWFDIRVDDLIDFDVTSFRLENRSEVHSRGVELEARLAPSDAFALRGFATYAKSEDGGSGMALRGRPEWRGGISLDWSPLDALHVRVSALFVGNVLDASVPTGNVELDGYERLDVVVSWTPWDWLELYAAVDNATNADWQEAVGFPSVSIRPRAGVRARWERR